MELNDGAGRIDETRHEEVGIMMRALEGLGVSEKTYADRQGAFRIGTVRSVVGAGVTVNWGADTKDQKEYMVLSSYSSPSVGDVVIAAAVGGTYYILGKVIK